MILHPYNRVEQLSGNDFSLVHINDKKWIKFLDCYNLRLNLEGLKIKTKADYSDSFFNFFDNKYGTLKQVSKHPCLMHVKPLNSDKYEVSIIVITSKNEKVIDFGSQPVSIFDVGTYAKTNYQGLVGSVYVLQWRKDELNSFIKYFNNEDIAKLGGDANVKIIKEKAADLVNKKKFVEFLVEDKDYKQISIEFLKMVNFIEGQRKSIILYEEKNKEINSKDHNIKDVKVNTIDFELPEE